MANMDQQPALRRRFWFETITALVAAVLAVLTAVRPDWIELFFEIEPDEGSGSLERLIVGIAVAVALTASLVALTEWRRFRRWSPSA
jgi:hypothetical protein